MPSCSPPIASRPREAPCAGSGRSRSTTSTSGSATSPPTGPTTTWNGRWPPPWSDCRCASAAVPRTAFPGLAHRAGRMAGGPDARPLALTISGEAPASPGMAANPGRGPGPPARYRCEQTGQADEPPEANMLAAIGPAGPDPRCRSPVSLEGGHQELEEPVVGAGGVVRIGAEGGLALAVLIIQLGLTPSASAAW